MTTDDMADGQARSARRGRTGHRPGALNLGCLLERVLPPERVERNVPMRLYTSFRIGGPADFLVTAETVGELAAVITVCRRRDVPFLILGRGTNVLVRDGGIRGVVIKMAGHFLRTVFAGTAVEAGAAVALGDLARDCGRRGLSGLEFAVGIPGTLGGAVIMNAGAYGCEMKDIVEAARVLRPEDAGPGGAAGDTVPGAVGDVAPGAAAGGEVPAPVTLSAAELDLGYRTSRPQREGWVVLSARLGLEPGDPDAIRSFEEEYSARRRSRQPLDLPSAGSVFKRPPGHYAGKLIEEAGLRGLRVGDAQVSEKHVGFIVNLGRATASDVLRLMDKVREAVFEKSGVLLEPEIRIVGED